MRNKLLLVGFEEKMQEQLEEILSPILEAGGELLLAKKSVALHLLAQESPALVMIERSQMGQQETWTKEGAALLIVCPIDEPSGENVVHFPFNSEDVLAKCYSHLAHLAPLPEDKPM